MSTECHSATQYFGSIKTTLIPDTKCNFGDPQDHPQVQ